LQEISFFLDILLQHYFKTFLIHYLFLTIWSDLKQAFVNANWKQTFLD